MDPGPSRDVVGGYYEMEPGPSRDVAGKLRWLQCSLVGLFKREIFIFPQANESYQTYGCTCMCIVLSKDL